VYKDAVRHAGRHDGADVYLVAAEVIPRAAVDRAAHCVPPAPPGEPGICVVARTSDGGWLQSCFTLAEICNPGSQVWLDRTPAGSERARIVGVAPGGVGDVVIDLPGRPGIAVLPVRDNVFAGSVQATPHELESATVRFR
jgi:hypothetical protein